MMIVFDNQICKCSEKYHTVNKNMIFGADKMLFACGLQGGGFGGFAKQHSVNYFRCKQRCFDRYLKDALLQGKRR